MSGGAAMYRGKPRSGFGQCAHGGSALGGPVDDRVLLAMKGHQVCKGITPSLNQLLMMIHPVPDTHGTNTVQAVQLNTFTERAVIDHRQVARF